MTQAEKIKTKGFSLRVNRFLYISFTLFALLKLAFDGLDDSWPMLAIALVFDPFNPEVSWAKRPLYQRAWLVVHLATVLVLGAIDLLGQ